MNNRIMDSTQFDKGFVRNNPDFFLSDSFDSKLKQKILNCELTIEDLFTTNKKDLEELMSKKIINNFEENTKKMIKISFTFNKERVFYKI